MKKVFIILMVISLFISVFVLFYKRTTIKEWFFDLEKKRQLPIEVSKNEVSSSSEDLIEYNNISDKNTETFPPKAGMNASSTQNDDEVPNPSELIKEEVNLKVPFIVQSPDQKWQGIYKEACEEASILMVYGFLESKEITVDFAMTQIADMINWADTNITISEDLTSAQTLELARGFYKLTGEVIKLNSIDDIKKIVSNGNLVIIPALGRELKNPNFKSPGPLYHMLVVKGYTKSGMIITNDPGTRKGKDYLYDPVIFWNAIADWDNEIKSPDASRKVGILLTD